VIFMLDNEEIILNETSSLSQNESGECDFSMLDDSLVLTPWERILANDDIVNFGDSLQTAMEKRNAKSR
jgi:hypothetical protein